MNDDTANPKLNGVAEKLVEAHRQVVEAHTSYLRHQQQAIQEYMASMERINNACFSGCCNPAAVAPGFEKVVYTEKINWLPENASYCASYTMAALPNPSAKSRFSASEVIAYLQGDLVSCFGQEFFLADTHTRTPVAAKIDQNLIGEVALFEPAGGPACRGYLRTGQKISAVPVDQTLLIETCMQAMSFYLAAAGFTLRRDGWRFQPVSDVADGFIWGVVPLSPEKLVCELFVDEIYDRGMPGISAHVLCSIDGHKVLLGEKLELQMVPDWPLSSMPESAVNAEDSRQVARIDGFALDYNSLINCALGRPTLAFGPGFAHCDGPRRVTRLPGPPYHFMTRITDLHGKMGDMRAGASATALYDIDPDAWYFRDNPAGTMPVCVLMEIALQPCGWLAAFTMTPQAAERELFFRNLDGEAIQFREIRPGVRTVTTEVKLLAVANVGDMIIEKFSVLCSVAGEKVFQADTAFGFFPLQALAVQKGFGGAQTAFPEYQDEQFAETLITHLPTGLLLRIDRITGYLPEGGQAWLGAIRAEKDIDSRDWFFKAHFFQDPVQPGSLGVEAILQTIQAMMLLENMTAEIDQPVFEPLLIGRQMEWHYRGQVTPDQKLVTVEFEVLERGHDERGAFVYGKAAYWVDGLQIYQVPKIGMRIIAGAKHQKKATDNQAAAVAVSNWQFDLSNPLDAWLADHCPTYTYPALPLVLEVEMMAVAALSQFPGAYLQKIERADSLQWVVLRDSTANGFVEVTVNGPDQANVCLKYQREKNGAVVAATARCRIGSAHLSPSSLPPLEPLRGVLETSPDPYENGNLFHGPRMQIMRLMIRGSNGAAATLLPPPAEMPVGLLNIGILDAALHCIPHDDYRMWCPKIAAEMVGYPVRIENLQLFGNLSVKDPVEVQARFVALESGQFPRTHLRISRNNEVLVAFDLVEILLPAGRFGSVPGKLRQSFLRDHRFVPQLSLSETAPDLTSLSRQEIARYAWLPGTLEHIYQVRTQVDPAQEIAVKEHIAHILRLHPSSVVTDADGRCLNLPLNELSVIVETDNHAVRVKSSQPEALDWQTVSRDWARRTQGITGFAHDLGMALIRCLVRRVVIADPQGYQALRGRPVLYLGNHQTGVESFLFLTIITTLAGTPAGAIAKKEHRQSWIGLLNHLADLEMGEHNPMRMLLFDRADQADMLRLLGEFSAGLKKTPRSLLVHVDGTRSKSAGAPVRTVSSVLIDLAIASGMAIVPVRFAGGLPVLQGSSRLEFPDGCGQQDYYLGQPVSADYLKTLPYAQRAQFVSERINSLGPTGGVDAPISGDSGFSQIVTGMLDKGNSEIASVIRAALATFPEPGEIVRSILSGLPMKLSDERAGVIQTLLDWGRIENHE